MIVHCEYKQENICNIIFYNYLRNLNIMVTLCCYGTLCITIRLCCHGTLCIMIRLCCHGTLCITSRLCCYGILCITIRLCCYGILCITIRFSCCDERDVGSIPFTLSSSTANVQPNSPCLFTTWYSSLRRHSVNQKFSFHVAKCKCVLI